VGGGGLVDWPVGMTLCAAVYIDRAFLLMRRLARAVMHDLGVYCIVWYYVGNTMWR